jgi:hypothetical protein
MTITGEKSDYDYAQARVPGNNDLEFFAQPASGTMPTANMVSSPSSSYSPFDPLGSPNSTNASDDTSVFCRPLPSSTPPPDYRTDIHNYNTDQPGRYPIAASTLTSSPMNNGTMTSYTIPAPDVTFDSTEMITGESAEHQKMRRRKRRRVRMACGTFGGVVAGAVVLGPIGMVLGGFGGAATTRAVSKMRERRKDQRVADQSAASIPIPVQSGEAA